MFLWRKASPPGVESPDRGKDEEDRLLLEPVSPGRFASSPYPTAWPLEHTMRPRSPGEEIEGPSYSGVNNGPNTYQWKRQKSIIPPPTEEEVRELLRQAPSLVAVYDCLLKLPPIEVHEDEVSSNPTSFRPDLTFF